MFYFSDAIDKIKSQFNEDGRFPKIFHAIWTPVITRVWVGEVNTELMDDFLEITFDLYFKVRLMFAENILPKDGSMS